MDLMDPREASSEASSDVSPEALEVSEAREALDKAPSHTGLSIAIGVLAAAILYCTAQATQKSYDAALFCSPFFVGAIVGVFTVKRPVRNAVYAVLLALLIAIASFREGVVCCLFSLPLVMPETILGALCGWTVRRYVRGRRARAALAGGLLLTCMLWQGVEGALDHPADHPLHVARSSLMIPAAPARVFAAITAREIEVQSDWPWFLRVGLPMPIRLNLEKPGVGARITSTFSQGRAIGHVTGWVPGRLYSYAIDRYEITDLPFHITRLGRSPTYGLRPERVDDWLTLVDTRYEIVALPSGDTELRRALVWRRHLAPAFYFSWLQQTIMQRGQDRLLQLIARRLAEDPPGEAALVAGLEQVSSGPTP